jgi:hypothetical protein
MRTATFDELQQLYRSMSDDQLLIVQAESATLTPVARTALSQEITRRSLSQAELNEAASRLGALEVEDERLEAKFQPFASLKEVAKSFLGFTVSAICWMLIRWLASLFIHSTEAQMKLAFLGSGFIYLSYSIWQAIAYQKRRRKELRPVE